MPLHNTNGVMWLYKKCLWEKKFFYRYFFELQNINTLTESGELLITIMSAFAQAESENYSSLAKLVYKRKYM